MSARALFAAALLMAQVASAATLNFTAASLDAIRTQYAGKPFILSLWSANECAYCLKELAMFSKLVKQHPDLPLVFVSIDTPDFVPEMEALLAEHGLADKPSWVFNDSIPERPRRAIDSKWGGEIPRTYLYDARHERVSVSGLLSESKLRAWMDEHL